MSTTTWSLAQYVTDTDTDAGVAIHADDTILAPPPPVAGHTLIDMLRDWPRWADLLCDLDIDALEPIRGAELVAPLTYPNKVVCAGVNYYDHAEEMGTARPDPDAEPFFFLKSPTTTIIGPNSDVPISTRPGAQVDWEAELGVVIGRRCAAADDRTAAEAIAGYLVANDISDRGAFRRTGSVFPAFDWDWVRHKNQDGFCPIGPGMVPAWLVPDPQALKIRLDVNGVVKQDSSTAQMVTGVHRLVAAASRLMTLEPGDIVLTGTPAGVGMPRQDFLRIDDIVTVEIEGLSRISNRIVGK
ncbi:fumarylacetoacetate hydrolase family protein [Nocardia sp. CA-135953]|uniref:fumarylacetoacetate hydrolase family protein n=1 Tax=Nocardia sp. CA-135953 TaxID=3239978 RepID=UPI003D970A06